MSRQSDHAASVHWARQLLTDDFVILDTETTGLGVFDQVVQVAVVDKTGAALLDTLVKPTRPIPQIARGIHGITDEMVASAPTFGDIFDTLLLAIGGKRVAIYNKNFDTAMLHQSDQLYQLEGNPGWAAMDRESWDALAVWEDVMIPYSNWIGDWSDYHGNYRWQKLPDGDHSALGDARATLATIKRMAGELNSSVTVPAMDDEVRGYALHYAKFYKDGDYNTTHESPLVDALSAFVADLAASYSQRAGRFEREKLAHAWLDAWRRDLGWRPVFEDQKKADKEA